MKKEYVILLLCMATISGWSQSGLTIITDKEGKMVVIPKFVSYDLTIPSLSYETYTPSNLRPNKIDFSFNDSVRYTLRMAERPMDMQVQSGAYKPFFDIYAPMQRRVSPMAFDFDEFVISPVNENIFFLTRGFQSSLPGIGGVTRVSSTAIWKNERWSVGTGISGSRFYTPYHTSPGFVGATHLYTSFQATEWLKLNAWGQYAFYNKEDRNNPVVYLHNYQPHTNVGGSMEFKFTDNFGIGIGVDYKYNPIRRKMEREQLFYPIFFKGR